MSLFLLCRVKSEQEFSHCLDLQK